MKNELSDIKIAFQEIFKGKNGDKALRYLFSKCHGQLLNFRGDANALIYEAGKYAMFCEILAMANIPQVDFLNSISNGKEESWKIRKPQQ
jgi:hypothetical protein